MGEIIEIDPRKKLPQKYILNDSLDQLHEIGLLGLPIDDASVGSKWKKYDKIVHISMWINLIRILIALLLPKVKQNEIVFLLIGDFHYYTPWYQNHYNIMTVVFTVICLFAYRLKFDQSSNTLKPFLMIKGILKPIEVGLDRELEIKMMLQRSKRLLKATKMLILISSISVFAYTSSIIFLNYSMLYFILLGIPWIVAYTFITRTLIASLSSITCYFHLICYYNSLKIRLANKLLRDSLISRRTGQKFGQSHVKNILVRFTQVYRDVSRDNEVWCEYCAVVYFSYVTNILITLYQAIFAQDQLVLRLVLGYYAFVTILVCMIYVFTAAMVNETLNETNRMFNQLNCHRNFDKINSRMKILCLIERLGKKHVGFYCWNLFVFNHQVIFKMMISIGLNFLLMVTASRF